MHIWGKGQAAGRVGSDFLSAIAGRVGPGQRFAGSGPRKVARGQLCLTYLSTGLTPCIFDPACSVHTMPFIIHFTSIILGPVHVHLLNSSYDFVFYHSVSE